MTIQAIPLPELGSYGGSELMMEAQGFTLDGQELLVRLTYTDTTAQLRHAAWTYDLASKAYSTDLQAALSTAMGQVSQDLAQIEVHAVQAFAASGQRGIAMLYSHPGADNTTHIALMVGNSVTAVDVLASATSPDASIDIRRFAISDDGRFVALQTSADLSSNADLMAGMADDNDADDIYLLDRQSQKITRVSVVAGDTPMVPSQLGDIAISNGLVQISLISEAAFVAKDTNANTSDAADAYLWSQSFDNAGLTGQPALVLLTSNGSAAIGGMSVSANGQPEFAGPLITTAGTYLNSSSPQLASSDENNSADTFVYSSHQTQRLSWNGQPVLDAGATVIGTSQNGQIAGLLSSSSAVAGDYGATQLLVIDTRDGSSAVLPTGASTGDGSIVSATLSPNGAWAAFTSNAAMPLAGNNTLPDGTLYLANTGFRIDEPATGIPTTGLAIQGHAISANTSTISDPDGAITLAYQWQRSDDANTWANIANATAPTYTVASDRSEVGKYLRLHLAATDPLGGTTEFTSEPQLVQASSRLTLTATHWKTGKGALASVDIGITQDGTGLKTAADGRISAQGFTDPDSMDDGHTVLKPQLGATGAQAAITLTDVLGALKVYLNKPLDTAYDTPYKYIAADFQGDGDVDLSDVLSLLKYYLKKPVDAAPAWVFVDSAQTVLVNGQSLPESAAAGLALSKAHAAPASIDVDLNSDTPLQLIGVLRGDLDGSVSV